jgi:hypothetical protein
MHRTTLFLIAGVTIIIVGACTGSTDPTAPSTAPALGETTTSTTTTSPTVEGVTTTSTPWEPPEHPIQIVDGGFIDTRSGEPFIVRGTGEPSPHPLHMAQEAVGCWRVVALSDGVFDGVLEIGDGFASVTDSEAVVTGGDGGGDECSFRNGDRYRPGAVGEFNGVVFGDVADERDTPITDREVEAAFSVEMVGNGDSWWPAQLVSVAFNVFGWVAVPWMSGSCIALQVLSHSTARFDPSRRSSRLV